MRGGGTDANVFFDLKGGACSSGVHSVDAPKKAFERGATDQFLMVMCDVGDLVCALTRQSQNIRTN